MRTIVNIWKFSYGQLSMYEQWTWNEGQDWRREFLKRWGNLDGCDEVKRIIYDSPSLKIALKDISRATKYTMVLGWRVYEEGSYSSLELGPTTLKEGSD